MVTKLFLTVLLLATHVVANASRDGSGSSFRGSKTNDAEVEFPGTVTPGSMGVVEMAPEQPQTATGSDGSAAVSSSAVISASSSEDSTSVGSESDESTSASMDEEDEEAPINTAETDSSTFQLVESEVCDESVVDAVYTLYANIRSAFDLCVDASNYQLFPYLGKHPSQAQVQAMAKSDACAAVFTVVIQANLPACIMSGMPLVSAVKTLLKIRVDLERGIKDSAPSVEVFQELLAWRYDVDRAQQAGVPDDSNSKLSAEFERNLELVLDSTSIVVNEDLAVDVRLANGSYVEFEDALELVVTDADASDLMPGYGPVKTDAEDLEESSSGSSSRSNSSVQAQSSGADASSKTVVWSLVVAVATSSFVLAQDMSEW